jgi:class 3 adenylate cyclase
MDELPSGTVTLLFTDVEGSTALVRELDDRYGRVLSDYRRVLRAAVSDAGGHEVDCRADEFFAAFQRAHDGVAAAVSAQRVLAAHVWTDDVRVRVRMGLHTGEPSVEGGAYLGVDVHRALRICAAGHGGQVLLSQITHDLVSARVETRDLGAYSLPGLAGPERIFQLLAPQLRAGFPPLRAESEEQGRFRGTPSRARPDHQTLTDTAWQVRRMLSGTANRLQQPLAELGVALFTGDRALRGADDFLARVDEGRLGRRLAEQRKLATAQARRRAESLSKQISSVDHLRDRRNALDGLAVDISGKLGDLHADNQISGLRQRVVGITDEVDEALSQAARSLDALSYKLECTRRRGIYRSGRKFVVPFLDESGEERQRSFDSMTEARDFRAALQQAGKRDVNFRVDQTLKEIHALGMGRGRPLDFGDDQHPKH